MVRNALSLKDAEPFLNVRHRQPLADSRGPLVVVQGLSSAVKFVKVGAHWNIAVGRESVVFRARCQN